MKIWPTLALVFLLPALALAQSDPDTPPSDAPPADAPPEEMPPEEEEPPLDESEEEGEPRKKPVKFVVRKVKARPAPTKALRINVDVEDANLADVMSEIGRQTGTTIQVAPGVEETLTLNLVGIPWRKTVEVIAKMTRCQVREVRPGLLLLEQLALVTTTLEGAPIAVACQSIAESAGIDVVLGPGVTGTVRLDVMELQGLKVLRLLARSAGAHLQVADGVVLITKGPLPKLAVEPGPLARGKPGPLLDIDLEEVWLDDFAARLGKVLGVKILPDGALKERLTLSFRGVDWRVALEAVADLTQSRVVSGHGGVIRLVSTPKVRGPVTLENADLRDALQRLAAEAGLNVIVDPRLQARVSVFLSQNPSATFEGLVFAAGLHLVEWTSGVRFVTNQLGKPKASTGPTPSGKRLDLVYREVPIDDAMEALGKLVERNILVDPNIQARLTCHLPKVDWRLGVEAIAASLDCQVEERQGGILLLVPRPRNRILARATPVAALLRLLAENAGFNLVLGPKVTGTLDLDLRHVHWDEALELVARLVGCKLAKGADDVLTVTRHGSPMTRAASPADRKYAEQIDAILAQIERAAKRRDLLALERANAILRAAVKGAQPQGKATPPPPIDPKEIALTRRSLETLLQKLNKLAAAQDVQSLMQVLADLRGVLREPGAIEAMRALLPRWKARLLPLGEIYLSLELQVMIAAGNQLLRQMAEASADERYSEVEEVMEKVGTLRDEMDAAGRDVFTRNGTALFVRASSLQKKAARLAKIKKRFEGLRVQATVTVTDGYRNRPAAAIVGGKIVRQGDVAPRMPQVAEILPNRVRFRHEGTDFIRRVR
ncbi:MAG: hypothetical protein JKY65_31455 [Planctomycetes bacterium]|nr:hypothetical protein [Planctomycetota bacterium]